MDEEFNKLSKTGVKKFLDSKSPNYLYKFKLYLDDKYYNSGDSIVDDWRYDMLKDKLQSLNPGVVMPVGSKLREGENRVILPYWMGSANKITPEEPKVFERWMEKNHSHLADFIITDKLDGVSCLLQNVEGKYRLFTRGDGTVGADISSIQAALKLPSNIHDGFQKEGLFVRGELIMNKHTFNEKYRGKSVDGKVYKNARNMVSGLIGAKTVRAGLYDVDFVAYELIEDGPSARLSQQLDQLEQAGFKVVNYILTDAFQLKTPKDVDDVTEGLEEMYIGRLRDSEYEIDGLIVQRDQVYERNTEGNPDYMFAFKMLLDMNIHETTVIEVEWNVSKWGRIKPVVIIEPVELNDVTISRVTGNNAKYIVDNGIGPGAVVKITRSKDVIPLIVEVVSPVEPSLPDDIPFTWDKNHVNIVTDSTQDNTMCVKLLSSFFAKMGIKHVSIATVKSMYDDGLNNLMKILGASKERLAKVPSFKEGMVNRTHDNIHNGLQNIKLSTLLGASGIFGDSIGRKRVEALIEGIPDLVTSNDTKSQLKKKILEIEGFSDITADRVLENIHWAKKFIKMIDRYVSYQKTSRVGKQKLQGMVFVFSGFRDKKAEDNLVSQGAKVTTTVSKNTTTLVVKDKSKTTAKIEKAKKLGINIISIEEMRQYL